MGPSRFNAGIIVIALVSGALSSLTLAAPFDENSTDSPYTPTTEAAIITSGLVASYPFNGNANDASGNGNNGTVFGATLIADRYGTPGSAYNFDGSSDYVRIPDSSSLNFTADFTISAWIRTAPTSFGRIVFSNMLETSPHSGYSFRTTNTGTMYAICGDVLLLGGKPVTSNTWRHVAFTLTGTTGRIYVDGQLDTSGTVAAPTVFTGDQTIGSSYTPFYFWDGALDDVDVFNRALSSAEIAQLAVPEPSGVCLLAVAGGILLNRRVRRAATFVGVDSASGVGR